MKTKATKTNAGYEYRGYNITKIGAGGPSGVAMTAWLIDGTPMEFRTLTMCVDAIDYFSRVIVQAPDTTDTDWWIEHLYDLAPADLAYVISEAQMVVDDANATAEGDR